jgi:hypothetical protein
VSERISGFRAGVFVYDQQNLPFGVGSSCLFFWIFSPSQCLLCLPVSFPFFRVLAPPLVGFEEARDFRFSHQTRLFEFLFTLGLGGSIECRQYTRITKTSGPDELQAMALEATSYLNFFKT